MRRTMMMALGAGLLAIAATQFPGAVLAKSGDRSLLTKRMSKTPVVAKPGQYRPALCYPGTKTPATWTYVSSLPPPKLCNGKIIEHYGKVCIHCNGFAPTYGQTCVSCKTGYMWNAAKMACCRGSVSVPIPK
jgi:hypothetical protein